MAELLAETERLLDDMFGGVEAEKEQSRSVETLPRIALRKERQSDKRSELRRVRGEDLR